MTGGEFLGTISRRVRSSTNFPRGGATNSLKVRFVLNTV